MTAHSALTGADLHEPKGAAAATAGQVYVADGAGSGAWNATPTWSNYTTTSAIKNINRLTLVLYMPNIASGGTASGWVVCPIAGKLVGMASATQAALGGSNTTLTASIGGTNVTSGVITHTFSGSAAGDVATASPSAANTLTANQAIKITSNAAGTGTIPAVVTLYIDVS